ncbi:hypothetical protein O2N63_06365 [Aliiroseovarius sp. KMU-50]|uniref:Dirigent protein n=1 Tax=Aliiroseovarius salicola TaxID=3009082 RepID=A0ABT4W1S3_9RHOB|nr:hypothetical protein [Aliiroseovarius sp. KMU-50]MDA5093708.1 hypothetical protein [Aliiroseovarius sp. KMU-50]
MTMLRHIRFAIGLPPARFNWTSKSARLSLKGKIMFLKSIPPVTAVIMALSPPVLANPWHTFEVAESPSAFTFLTASDIEVNGDSIYIHPFVSHGYIYPSGTLVEGVKGVTEVGDPAFPSQVIGTWSSVGWYVSVSGKAATTMRINSQQVFKFENGDSLITFGPESTQPLESTQRVVTEGTGEFEGTIGIMTQTLLDVSEQLSNSISFKMPSLGTGM